MTTAIAILAIWTLLSLPLSVILGASLRDVAPPELVGMDGDDAIYRDASGRLHRVTLFERSTA